MSHTIFSHKCECECDPYQLADDVSIPPIPDYVESPSKPEPPPHYSGEEIAFLEGCLQKLNSDCGAKILTDLNDETTTPLMYECCRDLLKIGRDCHLIVADRVSVYMWGYPSTSKAVSKSKYTWKDCVRRVESHIGAPISLG